MYKFAQILNNKIHWVLETAETKGQLEKRFASNIVFVDITDINPQPGEGWGYDGINFTAPESPDLMVKIREHRNKLLSESDWTQLADVAMPIEQKEVWAEYRQKLRDFPANCDPSNPEWPPLPE